jgi:hypothetical protein
MAPRDRRYLIGAWCIGPGIFNAIVNGLLGWAGTHALPAVPLWGLTPGVAADLTGTAFGVTFGTYLVLTWQVKRDIKAGKVGRIEAPPALASLFARLPEGTFARSVALGALVIPLFALPVIAVLAATGATALTPRAFVLAKAALASSEAAIVSPLLVMGHLARRDVLALFAAVTTPSPEVV